MGLCAPFPCHYGGYRPASDEIDARLQVTVNAEFFWGKP